jgi:hypothetical protein
VIEKALMSILSRHGITLGVCTINPTVGIEVPESEPRTEAPQTAVLGAFLGWIAKQTPQRRIIGLAAEYMSLSGSRRVEFLDLSWPQGRSSGRRGAHEAREAARQEAWRGYRARGHHAAADRPA